MDTRTGMICEISEKVHAKLVEEMYAKRFESEIEEIETENKKEKLKYESKFSMVPVMRKLSKKREKREEYVPMVCVYVAVVNGSRIVVGLTNERF